MVERNGDGAGIQDGELGDYPVRRVFADEQYTVAVLDPANAEQKTGAMRGVAQFTVADRRALAGGFARFEGGERAVFFGGAIEELEQRLVAEGRARPAARMEVEVGKDMAAETGQMNIDPVTGPVDFFGGIGMTLDIGGRKRFVERADIVAVKGVDQLLDIRAIDLDQRTGEFGIFREAVDLLRDLARWYRLAAHHRLGEGGAMFHEFRHRLAHHLHCPSPSHAPSPLR